MQACAPVLGIDASAALQLPGVVAFISAADLPPERNRLRRAFAPSGFAVPPLKEPLRSGNSCQPLRHADD